MTEPDNALAGLAGRLAGIARDADAAGVNWHSVLMEAQAVLDQDEEGLDVGTSLRGDPSFSLGSPSDVIWLRWWFRGTEVGAALAALSDQQVLDRLGTLREGLADRWEGHVDEVVRIALGS